MTKLLPIPRLVEYVCYIYIIINTVNGEFYVGKSKDVYNRFMSHLDIGENDETQTSLIAQSIREFGRHNFILELIERVDNKNDWRVRETYWINYFRTNRKERCLNKQMISGGRNDGDDYRLTMCDNLERNVNRKCKYEENRLKIEANKCRRKAIKICKITGFGYL